LTPTDAARLSAAFASGGALLSDSQIAHLINIDPMAQSSPRGVISYGLTSYGYDMRVDRHFKVFTNAHGNVVVDPKAMDERAFVDIETDVCIIPPNSFALAVSVEKFSIPRGVLGLVVGKSSYARCGLIMPLTPLEPTWCTSGDTEALTPDGWKLIKDLVKGDLVLTRNPDGAWAEFRAVQATQCVPFNGDLLHFNGRSVDQLVTPDHHMFVHHRRSHRRPDGTSSEIETEKLLPAGKIFGRHNYSLDRLVHWRGPEPATLSIAGRDWNADDFLEFYGSWLGDDSAYHGNDEGCHVKLAVVTKEEKRRRFHDVLARLGITAALEERGFHFCDKALCLWLKQHGHARDKFIRRDFLQLGPNRLASLLRGLMQSDGCAATNTYTTISRQLADDVQELIFKCGRAAIIREVRDPHRRYVIHDCDVSKTPKIRPEHHSSEPYTGSTYDITVPNHVFFCRRNGKASWTGNCGKVTIEISNTTPLPAKVYANEGIAQVIFIKGLLDCDVSYEDKGGRYQHQSGITLPFVEKP
jgi:deoxycytidine triphosphate deaminase